jgi:CRP-like cAMP-binding protein
MLDVRPEPFLAACTLRWEETVMVLTYIEKLRSAGSLFSDLPEEDYSSLLTLCSDIRHFGAKRDVIREGDRPDHVNLIIDGWACRYKMLRDGSRQITAFLIPGDFCDSQITLLEQMDHAIATLTDCRIAFVSQAKVREISERPRIARALWWASLVDEAVLRAWIVNLGRRDAFDRVGNLICELYARLNNVGLTVDGTFELPVTQEELADALGLTPVHINRTLKRLREEGLMTFRQQRIVILDVEQLQRSVGFNPNYLHLPRQKLKIGETLASRQEGGQASA